MVTTIFVVLALALIVRVAVKRLPIAASSSKLTHAQERANKAVISGLEFASSQLREDPTWPQNLPSGVVVDHPGVLRVENDNGNIRGELFFDGDETAEFRIRFNQMDDASGNGDGLSDPASPDFYFLNDDISVNNMKSKVEADAPLSNRGEELIPPHSSLVVVHGNSSGRVDGEAQQVAESIFRVVPDRAVDDGIIMAGGGINFVTNDGGKVLVAARHFRKATDSRIRFRSKKGITFRQGGTGNIALIHPQNDNVKMELSYDTHNYPNPTQLEASFPPRLLRTRHEDLSDSKDFYRLQWGEIEQASFDPNSSSTVFLPGGTYVYGQSAADPNKLELRYYNMEYDDYLAGVKAVTDANQVFQGGTVAGVVPDIIADDKLQTVRDQVNVNNTSNNPDGLVCKATSVKAYDPQTKSTETVPGLAIKLRDSDLRILPSVTKGIESVAFVPVSPRRFTKGDPQASQYPDHNLVADKTTPDQLRLVLKNAIFSSTGKVEIKGSVRGEGGCITSEGAVKIQAGKSLLLKSESKTVDEQAKEFNRINRMALKFAFKNRSARPPKGKVSSVNLTIYAKDRIRVSSFAPHLREYRDLNFNGLLYSWHNVQLSSADLASDLDAGVTCIKGAVVAYGADPISGDPGSNLSAPGQGMVSVRASDVLLDWDPSFLPDLLTLQPEGSALYTIERSALQFYY